MEHCIYCGKEFAEHSTRYYLFPRDDYPEQVSEYLRPLDEPDENYEEYLRYMGRRAANKLPRGRILSWDQVRELFKILMGTSEDEAAERRMEKRITGRMIDVPVLRKHIRGYQVCPACHNVLPDIGEQEPVIQIGLIASRSAGKSVCLCALAANNLHCLNTGQDRYEFRLMQETAMNLRDQVRESNAQLRQQLDLLHDEFMLKVMRFENGIVPGATDRMTPHPFLVRVRDRYTSETAVLLFYDCAGEFFDHPDLDRETELYYLRDLDWLFMLVDPRQVFPAYTGSLEKKNQKPIESVIRVIDNHWEHRDQQKMPGMSLVITHADEIGDQYLKDEDRMKIPAEIAGILRSQGGSHRYDPDVACIRKYYLGKLEAMRRMRREMHSASYRVIQENMISALGCGVDRNNMKTDPDARPQYLADVVYEMLIYLLDESAR